MSTHCNPAQLSFQALGRRRVQADFDGGRITSDAGGLLLREAAKTTGMIQAQNFKTQAVMAAFNAATAEAEEDDLAEEDEV